LYRFLFFSFEKSSLFSIKFVEISFSSLLDKSVITLFDSRNRDDIFSLGPAFLILLALYVAKKTRKKIAYWID
jgi:hypothetical protein